MSTKKITQLPNDCRYGRESDLADDGELLSPHWEAAVRRFQELVVDALH